MPATLASGCSVESIQTNRTVQAEESGKTVAGCESVRACLYERAPLVRFPRNDP
jgi:hypothetical protein